MTLLELGDFEQFGERARYEKERADSEEFRSLLAGQFERGGALGE